ncbi:MAG: prephenate dehydratase [Lachnospiraceae bacterium]|nr:prephenate dehydratase [Lachnospiraceae bacterium]
MIDLGRIRTEIDETDREILRLFEKRMTLSEEVALSKLESGKSVADVKREKEVLEGMSALASTEFNAVGVREVFRQLIAISKKRQYQLLVENGKPLELNYIQKDSLEFPGEKVVFQGAEGAYTYAAMKEFFEKEMEFINVPTWKEAMELVASGERDWGVFPIENSTAGSVSDVYDLMTEYPIYIVGEQVLPISHTLMKVPGAKTEEITTLYSHPQALAQCRKFLEREYPHWQQREMLNTALAAKKIAEDRDPSQAAIASKYAAELYGLEIFQDGGMTREVNSTRFVIVSNKMEFRKDAKHISICVEIPHESGSLYNILSHFIFNDLNMFRIKSRPIEDKPWEYRFFIDFEGNLSEAGVQNALLGIATEANVRLLGNY